MDFRQLVYITKIADCKNITKAAGELYISQPSLSHFVAKTESELGIKLFERINNTISLTYAGECYVKTAQEILLLQSNLLKQFEDINQGEQGTIRLGISQGRAAFMLPLILKEYRKLYPNIEITTFEAKTAHLKDSLQSGKVDMIIMPEEPLHPDLTTELIYREELLLICAKDNAFAQQCQGDVVDWSMARQHPFVLLEKGHGIRNLCDTVFTAHHVQPRIQFETTSNTLAYRLAEIGEGLAIVPRRTVMVNTAPLAVYHLDSPPVYWDVIVAYQSKGYLSKIQRDFIQITQRIFQQM